MNATIQVQLRMRWPGRLMLGLAIIVARWLPPLRIPHSWIVAVTNRSWEMKVGRQWKPIRINSEGRVIG